MFGTRRAAAPVAAAIAVGALALTGCGESAEEKATAQVCSSTKAIKAQFTKLGELQLTSKAPEEVKSILHVVEQEVAKIKESTSNLSEASKAPVQAAQNSFQTELVTLGASLASTAKSSGNTEAVLKQAEPEIKSAASTLVASYKQAYESLKCS